MQPADSRLDAESQAKKARAAKAITATIVMCFCFMVAEGTIGFIAKSLAVLTDAAHMLTDVGALSLALLAIHASKWSADSRYTYGWKRAEVLGALGSVFTIWALVGGIMIEAVRRIIDNVNCARDYSDGSCVAVEPELMLIIGCVGLGMNFACAAILSWGGHHGHSHGASGHHGGDAHSSGDDHHGHSHGGHEDHHATSARNEDHHGHSHDGHSCGGHHGEEDDHHGHHGHDEGHHVQGDDHGHIHGGGGGGDGGHGHECSGGHDHGNMNVRGAFLHALGDCIQSVGVIVAALIIWLCNNHWHGTPSFPHSYFNLADPCCSIFFGVVTLYTTIGLFRELFAILMESTPRHINFDRLRSDLEALPGVNSVHDLHIWSLTAENVALSAHLVSDAHSAVLTAAQAVCARHGITHTTIQVDPLSGGTPCSCMPADNAMWPQ